MKRYLILALSLLALLPSATSCSEAPLDPNSIITVDSYEKNAFDLWLDANFVYPYNIEFKYRYENNESDLNYYSVPAAYDNAIVMAHLVKYLCIDSYDEVAGVTFTRTYFPKEFFLMGEWEYKNNGVYTLGTAEGGKKIILMGINYLPKYSTTAENLNYYYLKTIHHEFTHILNQTKDFPVTFSQVSGASEDGYLADSWNAADYSADHLQRGFITRYSQHSDREDFAECMSMYVTHDAAWWEAQLAAAKGETKDGSAKLATKMGIVKSYMAETFDINLDDLRDAILRREAEVMAGLVDLHSVEVY
ncbi:MAG: putative zinc-binding metallopeptidase [Bacteroidales bacterium]|nr:putative zinc-binding metallopeptidase [Bacteroidales bacterium]